ncbi:hypothetical protein BCR43DRAFT_536875 [Syncephalastrum racemosum]|uniref:HMG box domain-containing protein n=1 Tax=Syncephalastrum racemosum TaxID=13706 RepID=A0A1X2HY21_SYNRA|nr:hypothetical protein BCR43DRAFT_536875 [Syncephalastrum racemosum]
MVESTDERISAIVHSLRDAFTQAASASTQIASASTQVASAFTQAVAGIEDIATVSSGGSPHAQHDDYTEDEKEEQSKRAGKRKRARDPLAPKRPNRAYRLYVTDVVANLRKEMPNQSDIFKRVSENWKVLDQARKDRYQAKYEKNKKTYERELDEFKQYRQQHPFTVEKELKSRGPVEGRRVLKHKSKEQQQQQQTNETEDNHEKRSEDDDNAGEGSSVAATRPRAALIALPIVGVTIHKSQGDYPKEKKNKKKGEKTTNKGKSVLKSKK